MSNGNRSVLFAEISGSARLREKLDHGEAVRAVDRCAKRVERAAEAFGGRLVNTLGGQLIAIFELPDQAFRAASEIQQRIADLPPVSGVKLAIRIGLAHGPISEDQGHLVGETVNAAARLAGQAKPGQILTGAEAALPQAWQDAAGDQGASFSGQRPETGVVERSSPPQAKPAVRFSLRYGDQRVVLNEGTISVGRDAQCDLEIRDRRASRQHARIERRDGVIVLVDSSSNGTYVTQNGDPELFVRGGECVIHGRGLICFAASASSPDADCAQFEQD